MIFDSESRSTIYIKFHELKFQFFSFSRKNLKSKIKSLILFYIENHVINSPLNHRTTRFPLEDMTDRRFRLPRIITSSRIGRCLHAFSATKLICIRADKLQYIRTPWRSDNERRKESPPFLGHFSGPDPRPELLATISRRGAPRRTDTPSPARSAL